MLSLRRYYLAILNSKRGTRLYRQQFWAIYREHMYYKQSIKLLNRGTMYRFPLILLIVLSFSFEKAHSACRNKSALASVDALVHKQRNSRAVMHRNENFNILDSYVAIDVISANISELCEGMIKNFERLERLSFISVNLSILEPGAFQKVPKLQELSLSVNEIQHVPRGVFDPIKSLKVIYLARNRIKTIEDAAFARMPNLKAVHLEHNELTSLSGNVFFGSSMLSLVDYSFNALTKIEANSFDDLKPSSSVARLNVHLKRNKIESIDPKTLSSFTVPVDLHLESNELTGVWHAVYGLKETSQVFLANNRIECIAHDVLDLVKTTDLLIDVKNNPIQCQCIDVVEETLDENTKGVLTVKSNLPCGSLFGNQLL